MWQWLVSGGIGAAGVIAALYFALLAERAARARDAAARDAKDQRERADGLSAQIMREQADFGERLNQERARGDDWKRSYEDARDDAYKLVDAARRGGVDLAGLQLKLVLQAAARPRPAGDSPSVPPGPSPTGAARPGGASR